MNSAIERLLTLRVVDIMNTSVAVVPYNITMSKAAEVLAEFGITGAPVVDDEGRCIGVLSSTDFAGRARVKHTSAARGADSPEVALAGLDQIGNELVEEHMSPMVQTVSEMSPITSAARIMCREHIHRLVIVDDDQRPVGVVSSLDLVASMIAGDRGMSLLEMSGHFQSWQRKAS